jgi:hypothetical protein
MAAGYQRFAVAPEVFFYQANFTVFAPTQRTRMDAVRPLRE